MSAIGPKQTSLVALHMSAFGGKADMPFCAAYVLTQSEHSYRAFEREKVTEYRERRELPQIRDAHHCSSSDRCAVRLRDERKI